MTSFPRPGSVQSEVSDYFPFFLLWDRTNRTSRIQAAKMSLLQMLSSGVMFRGNGWARSRANALNLVCWGGLGNWLGWLLRDEVHWGCPIGRQILGHAGEIMSLSSAFLWKSWSQLLGRRGVWISLVRLLPMQTGTIEVAENASNHSFLPQPNSMHVRLTGDSKLAIGVWIVVSLC